LGFKLLIAGTRKKSDTQTIEEDKRY